MAAEPGGTLEIEAFDEEMAERIARLERMAGY